MICSPTSTNHCLPVMAAEPPTGGTWFDAPAPGALLLRLMTSSIFGVKKTAAASSRRGTGTAPPLYSGYKGRTVTKDGTLDWWVDCPNVPTTERLNPPGTPDLGSHHG